MRNAKQHKSTGMAFKSSDGRLEGYWIGEVELCAEQIVGGCYGRFFRWAPSIAGVLKSHGEYWEIGLSCTSPTNAVTNLYYPLFCITWLKQESLLIEQPAMTFISYKCGCAPSAQKMGLEKIWLRLKVFTNLGSYTCPVAQNWLPKISEQRNFMLPNLQVL